MDFLPISTEDLSQRGWEATDFILISGDAYVDHPSFGAALISRVLEAAGFRVGLISRPDWKQPEAFQVLGKPRYAFLVTSGNLDSMLSNYTAAKKRRREDDYAPGGVAGGRPNRAVVVYCQVLRQVYGAVPIIIGGIEASLRRLVHYDYWDDALRQSILADSQANLLIYGSAERALLQVGQVLREGGSLKDCHDIPGTAYLTEHAPDNAVRLPGLQEMREEKRLFAEAFRLAAQEENPYLGSALTQPSHRGWLVVNPPAKPLSTAELDSVYELPYTRRWHPSYDSLGGIPALAEVEFSISSHRGCFGGCSFCALTSHQGRIVQCRSMESLVGEALRLTKLSGFKGYIHDLSGPTVNFRQPACAQQAKRGACSHRQCLFPQPCPNLEVEHRGLLQVLRAIRQLPGVKKVFIRSGLRYDYLLLDGRSRQVLKELCEHHISGQLKVAPEHVSLRVTQAMGKPPRQVFDEFRDVYQEVNQELGRNQYLVPYFMSSHPGCGLQEGMELAEYLRDMGFQPQQVQDFIPTPGSLATAIYYSGLHPITKERQTVVKSAESRDMQRALLQYRKPANRRLVLKALQLTKRQDLIGSGSKALVRP